MTLWKLDRYVRQCLKPKKKKPTQQEIPAEAQRAEMEAERELMQVEQSSARRTPASTCPRPRRPRRRSRSRSRRRRTSATATQTRRPAAAATAGRPLTPTRTATTAPRVADLTLRAGLPPPPRPPVGLPWSRRQPRVGPLSWCQQPASGRGLALKQNASRKEVTIQNQAGWANLADKPENLPAPPSPPTPQRSPPSPSGPLVRLRGYGAAKI